MVAWLGHASSRRSTGPASGGPIEPLAPPARTEKTIRVGTFNIHGCKGRDGSRNPARIADCLVGLDLIALQEVRGGLWPAQTDQTGLIAQRLGAHGLFAPAETRWYGGFASGNALISRLPITWWYRSPLPRTYDRSYRNLLLASVEHQGRVFRVLLTHIVRRDERERAAQLATAIAMFLSLQEPALLLGDLNTTADDPHLRKLLDTPGVEDPLARQRDSLPADRVDWILARGFRTIDAGLIDRGASDHPLVWAELEMAAATPGFSSNTPQADRPLLWAEWGIGTGRGGIGTVGTVGCNQLDPRPADRTQPAQIDPREHLPMTPGATPVSSEVFQATTYRGNARAVTGGQNPRSRYLYRDPTLGPFLARFAEPRRFSSSLGDLFP